jgi:hypothetical protein
MRLSVFVLGLLAAVGADAQPNTQLVNPLEGTAYDSATTLDDQTDVAVTVYNAGIALVRDRREVKLLPGEQRLTFSGVAQQIRPETVSLKSVTSPGKLRILEQNYEYDLMSPSKMMEKYVGKQVRLLNQHADLAFDEVSAELLSINEGAIYKIENDIYLGHPGNVVLPRVPDNLIAKPSLVWTLDNRDTDHTIEASYLTGGIDWKADYVLTLDRNDQAFDLEGWVTLNNQSGAQYTDAQLKLVAGNVNIAPQPQPRRALKRSRMAEDRFDMSAREETFAEYHLYTIPRRTTIKENQSKQVSLLNAARVGCEKVYGFHGNTSYYRQQVAPMREQHVAVFLKFDNKADNNMGMPLPGGVIRVYQSDSEGALQFAGEDRVKHTPKDETVRIRLGEAFDVVAERIQSNFRVIADRVFESEFEIKVRNHKNQDIVVQVIEPMTSDWEMIKNSHEYVKRDAHTAVFDLPVPKDGETILTYRVLVKY